MALEHIHGVSMCSETHRRKMLVDGGRWTMKTWMSVFIHQIPANCVYTSELAASIGEFLFYDDISSFPVH